MVVLGGLQFFMSEEPLQVAEHPIDGLPMLGETLKEFFQRTTDYWSEPNLTTLGL